MVAQQEIVCDYSHDLWGNCSCYCSLCTAPLPLKQFEGTGAAVHTGYCPAWLTACRGSWKILLQQRRPIHYLTTMMYWWSTLPGSPELRSGGQPMEKPSRLFFTAVSRNCLNRHELLTKRSLLPLLLWTSHICFTPVGKLLIKPPRGAKINVGKWWWATTPNWSRLLDFSQFRSVKVHVVNRHSPFVGPPPHTYCAFHKYANSEVQKPTDDCAFRCRHHLNGSLKAGFH